MSGRLYDAQVASYGNDPRCLAMAEALVPLLRRACPVGAGGYGGSYQVNLDDEEAVGLVGVDLIRAAMRKAARELGWKVTTIGWAGNRFGTMVAIEDTRDAPAEYRPVVEAAMHERMRTALSTVHGEPGGAPVRRNSVALMTREFQAAVAATSA
ncbi:hypothetical protein ACFWXK_38370 [Streptomyces sp. NPDC059070]|uniref:hypothetical protein n=1 Tax=Streptomyces sp. NPDC059070 TaxID=3346713 RepID=UPI00367F0551